MIKRKRHQDVYDIESYPNFFSVIFKDIKTGNYRKFIIFDDTEGEKHSINQAGELLDFLVKEIDWLIGFNNHEYDDLLLAHMIWHAKRMRNSHPRKVCEELFELGDSIIKAQKKKKTDPRAFTLRKIEKNWRSLDLIQIFNPIDRIGLKRIAIALKWPKIADLPYKPGSIILAEYLPKLLEYHYNDVDMTERVKDELAENINNRMMYYVKYGTDVLNSSNSAIGRQMMADLYSKHTGLHYTDFKKQQTNYHRIQLSECIVPNIHFKTEEYQKALKKIQETVIDPNRKEDETYIDKYGMKKKRPPQLQVNVSSKYLTHTVMLGGIHSNGPAEIMEENEKYFYIDLDVAGYYPRIIGNNRLHPAHLSPDWTDIFIENVVEERKKIKKSDPVLAYMLKIAANAAFGLMDVKGDAESWLKDPKVAKTITVSGQMYLCMLMEGLEIYTKCLVVYSNTDGLTVRVPREELEKFYNICNRWQIFTGFELEYVQYRKMIVRDVNNYLMFSYDEEKPIKAKGAYNYRNTMATDLKVKGLKYPIIAMAVEAWYDKGTDVEEFIRGHQDIYDFMKAENTSEAKYHVILHHTANPSLGQTLLQKNNRWIVTKGNPLEGRCIKHSLADGKKTEMQKGFAVTSVNNVDDSVPIQDYKLNYNFYIEQALRLINLTIPLDKETHIEQTKQVAMFEDA